MTYINMRDGEVETVDQFETREEALKMLAEYQMAFNRSLYLSTRCTREWKGDE